MRRKRRQACLAVLRQTFGISGFRPGQKAAVNALLSGRDVLCILPTGAGKSLCWQLPAVMQRGLTVVVSPLIALMDDQVQSLRRRGVPAETLNSLMTAQERQDVVRQVRDGSVRILLVSPERLETQAFQQLCQACPPWLVVVDEAHCVVQWGEAFRPPYARIGTFVASLPRRPVLCAMTATADVSMQKQIIRSLGLSGHKRVLLPVMRENLRYVVRTTTDRTGAILRLCKAEPMHTVIFCRSRLRTERLATALRQAGLAAAHYHAGLSREERIEALERFRSGRTTILAATTAFGMGVDIPDIRRVIHDSLPDSVTDLVQQSGRAGRDGLPADCIVLICPEDFLRSRRVLNAMHLSSRWRPIRRWRLMRKHWRPMKELLRSCLTARCIPAAFSSSFGQRLHPCGVCAACTEGPLCRHVPHLPSMDAEQLQLWLLRWQRDAIASARGVLPQLILDDAALREAARSLVVQPMKDVRAQQALQRLCAAMARAAVEKPGSQEC